MWSRTQNNFNDDNNYVTIINQFFHFINNVRNTNNRILQQNDNLAEMSYEMVLAYLYSSRYSNTNTSNTNTSNTNTTNSNTTNTNTRSRSNSRTNTRTNSRSTVRSNIRNSLYQSRNDWRNINRRNQVSNTRNVRPRNINNNNVITRQNNLQSPISNIIPMFGPIGFGSSEPSARYNPLPNTLEHIFHQALQPVTIRPTPEQISRATEERIFDQISQPMNDRCPITRNRFNNGDTVLQILECRHCFHPQSLRTWFETSVRCPICRYDIREYNPLNVINNPYNNSSNNQDTQNTDETTEQQPEDSREDTTSSQDIARELVMNELNNINNDPSISNQQRNLANIISQSIASVPSTNNEELVQTESSIDSNGNLNLTYQFGINLPSNSDQSNIG